MTSKCVKRFPSVINLLWVCLWGLTPWIVTGCLVCLMCDLKPCSPITLQAGDSSALVVVMPDRVFLLRFLSCYVEVIPHTHPLGSVRALTQMVGTMRLLGTLVDVRSSFPLGLSCPGAVTFMGWVHHARLQVPGAPWSLQ